MTHTAADFAQAAYRRIGIPERQGRPDRAGGGTVLDMDDLAARLHSHFILDAMCPTGCDHEAAPTEEHAVAIVALEYVRAALLSDEAVLRALNAGEPRTATDNLADWGEGSIARMRAALAAALGEGEYVEYVRLLKRQREPWQDLADTMQDMGPLVGEPMSVVEELAKQLHEAGWRVTGDE